MTSALIREDKRGMIELRKQFFVFNKNFFETKVDSGRREVDSKAYQEHHISISSKYLQNDENLNILPETILPLQ
jgi:hypothetical protein